MLRNLLVILGIIIFASSCLKNNTGCPYGPRNIVAPTSEQTALQTFLDTNNILAVKHPSGFFYNIIAPGTATGDSLGLCSEVLVKYTGRLTNGTVFDSQESLRFPLGEFIDGWRIGIPLVRKNGQLKLYIPPSLGYGNMDLKDTAGVVRIPANSILVFDVQLKDYSATY